METTIKISNIKANPYQPRKNEDPNAVMELAQNILHNATEDFDGLLQKPTVRKAGDDYELAFGHTRLASFALLVEQGHERYEQMRVDVRDLSDLQMFEFAVTENIKRRDLNPIEQAESIRTYMDTFGKTSAEAAAFFGVAASTVRGMVRLLNLPDVVQTKVRSGEINTGAARALLVVEKLMGKAGVDDVMERMEEDGDDPMEAIDSALRFSSETERLDRDYEWVKADPFPRKHWKPIKEKEIVSLLIIEDESELDGKKEDIARLISFVEGGMDVTDEAFPMFEPDALERVRVVANPPGCTSCPMHAQLEGDHYCALKLCADRKKESWFSEVAESVSAETGIPMYDKAHDGAFDKLIGYDDANAKLFKERHADLRLMPSKTQVWGNTNYVLKEGDERDVTLSDHVQVVAVGGLYEKRKKKAEKQKAREEKKAEKEIPWNVRSQINRVEREVFATLQWELASKSFASMFDGLNNFALLKALCFDVDYPGDLREDELVEEAEAMKKVDGLAQLRRIVANGITQRETNYYDLESQEVVIEYGKQISELAKTMGVKLPKDWDTQVKKYQDECTAAVDEIVNAWKEKA